MNIPSFENYQCVPKDFTGFWWFEIHKIICYAKNGKPENIFGAACFLPDGKIQKIMRDKDEPIYFLNFSGYPKPSIVWKQYNKDSPEAKYSWSLFKFYLILDL